MTYFNPVSVLKNQPSPTGPVLCNKKPYVPDKSNPHAFFLFSTLRDHISEYKVGFNVQNSRIINDDNVTFVEKTYMELATRSKFFANFVRKMGESNFNQLAPMLNTVSEPMLKQIQQCKSKRELQQDLEAMPTLVLWYLKCHRKDLVQVTLPKGDKDAPVLEKLIGSELSRRGIDVKKIEGPKGNDYLARHFNNQSKCYIDADADEPK